MLKKGCLVVLVLLVVAGVCFVAFIGPWPTYAHQDLDGIENYRAALAAIDLAAAESDITATPGPLQAGWGARSIVPKIGTPLFGYGARKGAASTGAHDEIHVKALALSDGKDTVVIVGSDMLIVPDNVANLARAMAAERTGLTPNDILFNASHTHSGPGGYVEGPIADLFGGGYVPEIPPFLGQQYGEAIVEAFENLEPARVAPWSVDASQYIRNRTREAKVDGELNGLAIEQDDGDRCTLLRFSAHPTILGGDNLEFSGDFPGFLQRYVIGKTDGEAIYLGGAVGSMGSSAPEGPNAFARAEAMGVALGDLALAAQQHLEWSNRLDIASVGIPIKIPSIQLRLSRGWRVSPYFPSMLGINDEAWLQAVRVGDLLLVGAPCDYSGELSVEMRDWAAGEGLKLWMLSFNGDYIGYISPDEYYYDVFEKEGLKSMANYETRIMSWAGPDQETFFNSLIQHMADRLDDAS